MEKNSSHGRQSAGPPRQQRQRQDPHHQQPAVSNAVSVASPIPDAQRQQQQGAAAPAHQDAPSHHHWQPHPKQHDFLNSRRFADLPIQANVKKALAEEFKYEQMSHIQAAAIPLALEGKDLLAKARTGTGKTLGFLIPIVERLLQKNNAAGISALVVSPTRELAMQIDEEFAILTTFLKQIRSVVTYGGTNIKTDQRKLDGRVDVVIATPGRLIDHLDNTNGFAQRIGAVSVLVLDEADQMLDMGFRPSILKILSFLPTPAAGRQTLLFSATIPKELVQIAPQIMRSQFEFIDAVGSGDGSVAKTATMTANDMSGSRKPQGGAQPAVLQADNPFATAQQVVQNYVVVQDTTQQLTAMFSLLQAERERNPKQHKIIVFFTTARQTQLGAELCNAMGLKTLEIHSRMSQSARQRASDAFHDNVGVTMFSSDVTARGMDYPDVTYVLQVGLPASAEQYIHRLGRTARAGKEGSGTLLLFRDEQGFVNSLKKDVPIKDATSVLPQPSAQLLDQIAKGLTSMDSKTKAQAYAAWLGYYNSAKMPWNKEELVRQANLYAVNTLQLRSPPEIPRKTVGKMGLKGVPGLVLEAAPGQHSQQQSYNRQPMQNQRAPVQRQRESYHEDEYDQPSGRQPAARRQQPQQQQSSARFDSRFERVPQQQQQQQYSREATTERSERGGRGRGRGAAAAEAPRGRGRGVRHHVDPYPN